MTPSHQHLLIPNIRITSLSLVLVVLLLMTIGISAQDASPTPAAPTAIMTQTLTPMPTQPTATPTITPQPDPTLGALMHQPETISTSNVFKLREFSRWPAYEEAVINVVFMPDGDLVATGSYPPHPLRYVQRWDIEGGSINPVGRIFQDLATGGYDPKPVQLSDDGRFLLAAAGGPGVTIWDAPTGRKVGYIGVADPASAIIYDGNIVLIGGRNGLVSLWAINNLPDGTSALSPEYTFQASSTWLLTAFRANEEVVQVARDRNISFALTRSGVLYLHTWNSSETLTQIRHDDISRLDEPMQGNSIQMVVDRDQQQVFYVASAHWIIGYDYANHRDIMSTPIEAGIGCIVPHPQNDMLIIGDASESGTLYIYRPDDFQIYSFLGQIDTGHPLTSCVLNQDGTLLALGDAEGEIALWGVSP